MNSPLLIAYDAEDERQRRFVDRLQARDRRGLIICFPIQNPELVRVAPELAGMLLNRTWHAMDLGTRRIYQGQEACAQAYERIPAWCWMGVLMRLPGLGALLQRSSTSSFR